MPNKPIIISLIIFLLLSFGFLAYTQTRQQSPASQNWWVVYFTNPKGDSLDFVVENNSNENMFHWEALADKSTFDKGDVEIKKGEKKEIKIIRPDIESFARIRFGLVVSNGNENRELYKD
jgi:hypothetical protein